MLNRTALGLTIASMLVLSSTVAFADVSSSTPPDQQNILQSNAAQVITAGRRVMASRRSSPTSRARSEARSG